MSLTAVDPGDAAPHAPARFDLAGVLEAQLKQWAGRAHFTSGLLVRHVALVVDPDIRRILAVRLRGALGLAGVKKRVGIVP